MAEPSIQDPGLTGRKVWTFVLRGGEKFILNMPRTPLLEHKGGMTLWKMIGTEQVALAAETLIRESGAEVELHTEWQTKEQAEIRQQRLTPPTEEV